MNILVLYSRFSAYINSSFSHFASLNECNIHVVRYAADKNSPFELSSNSRLSFYNRSETDFAGLTEIITKNDIKVIVCSGWADKLYMKIARWAFKRRILTICIMDNQWMGTYKQRLLVLLSPLIMKRRFRKVWIPGIYQFEYARRLGFKRYDIMLRYYTADTNLFIAKPVENICKKFIYVGRLLEIKGVDVLYKSVVAILPELKKNGWKFVIIGSGEKQQDFEKLAIEHDCIEYHKFLQPVDLASKTSDGGVFVLPSNYDAWGVVVHEFALLGCPLILSEAVGSRSAFLVDEYNGKVFVTGSHDSLVDQYKFFMSQEQETLNQMGEHSQMLASNNSLDTWSFTLKSTIDEYFSGVEHKPLKRTKYQ